MLVRQRRDGGKFPLRQRQHEYNQGVRPGSRTVLFRSVRWGCRKNFDTTRRRSGSSAWRDIRQHRKRRCRCIGRTGIHVSPLDRKRPDQRGRNPSIIRQGQRSRSGDPCLRVRHKHTMRNGRRCF